MIRKFILSSLLMGLSYCFVDAQENPELKFKHDAGFNTSFILQGIFNSSQTPFSAMASNSVLNKINRFCKLFSRHLPMVIPFRDLSCRALHSPEPLTGWML